MQIRSQEQQFISGDVFGYDASVKIHATANLIGDIDLGPNARIDGGVTITGRVRIGRNCHIATGATLLGAHGITIGNNCGISMHCVLVTGTDDPDSGRLALHAENELPRAAKIGAIVLGDYVTLGALSYVGPGVMIGDCAMIGCLSRVSKSLAGYAIYAGNPLGRLRDRPPLEYSR